MGSIEKIDLGVLFEKFFDESQNFWASPTIILCDHDDILYFLSESAREHKENPFTFFDEKKHLSEFVLDFQNQDLFSSQKSYIVTLPKFTSAKKWAEDCAVLKKIQDMSDFRGVFVGKTNLRKNGTALDFLKVPKKYLCYQPTPEESFKAITQIASFRFPNKTPPQKTSLKSLIVQASDNYGSDFASIDQHFLRMKQMNCSFAEAQNTQSNHSIFSLTDALATANRDLFVLRFHQLQNQGVEQLAMLGSLTHFLRLVFCFAVELMRVNNIKNAFLNLKIPFPAQKRIQTASRNLKQEDILKFLQCSSEIEFQLKSCAGKDSYLLVEILNQFNFSFLKRV